DQRGSGLSLKLMETAERQAREWQAKWICLHVRRGATGIAAYYERQGFVRDPKGDFDRLPEVFLQAYRRAVGA
ncbi:GNAT family N-acetyltransferase, partial [bacterium]|nr:GNAT family N-acetyltransferase [bacterium]